ncbi:uncharacterized protein [Onthophagus taurus]|uniref:uncharacterized protein n=1 Tax=Onthophagus taurus TaxID=166361 RepID=UPI0039BE10CD
MSKTVDSVIFLAKYINQLETIIETCSLQPLVKKVVKKLVIAEVKEDEEKVDEKTDDKKGDETVEEEETIPVINKELASLKVYQETEDIYEPQMCIWDFMGKEDLEQFLSINNRGKLREILEQRLGKSPTGFSKLIAVEFLLDATNFCRRSTFNTEQCGSIISMLYWTHKFFTSNLFVCPEDVFNYFRQFLVFHVLFFPPTHLNLFTPEEGEVVLKFFFRLYLRHLPLVRMLTLPNFGFELEYVLEPDMKPDKGKGKGKGKGKDKKGGKKKK